MNTVPHLVLCLSVLLPPALLSAPASKDYYVYVGTYTAGKKSQGIYLYRFNASDGKLAPVGLAAQTVNPSFLTIHPNRRFLYAVSEISRAGAVAAFSIDSASGKLTELNKESSRGSGPCYVAIDKSGKAVLVANYNSGSVAVLPVKADGTLGAATAFVQHTGSSVDPRRQKGPHAHSINPSPDDRFAIAADLGLDKLFVYRFDAAKGSLEPNDPPFTSIKPGSGPRHFAFHPNGKFAYAISEMGSIVTALSWDAKNGVLKELQVVSTLPKDFHGQNDCAEVQVHPSGKFVYGSNRGHDSIAVFSVDPRKGTLTPVEYAPTLGKTPRNFRIDPTGTFLIAANQDSDSLAVFRIDQKTGKLTPTGQVEKIGAPVCVRFLER